MWITIESTASKIGFSLPSFNEWVKRHQVYTGSGDGITTSELQRLKELERGNKELCKANEIFKLVSTVFAQAELDRRLTF